MPDFQYIARELSGKQVSGLLSAGSEAEAAATLTTRQLFPVKISPAKGKASAFGGFGRRVKARTTAAFFAQLADLLKSGVPLLRSLELLERQTTHAGFRPILRDVREQVADGQRLAEAMRRHPKAFPELARAMVRAGEEGGFLEDVLKRIADFTEHQEDLKGRVTGAIAYPLFLLVLGLVVVAVLMVWFVPKFEPIFERLSKEGSLPLPTQILQSSSVFFQNYWMWILAAIIAGIVAIVMWVKSPSGQRTTDAMKIRSPGVGPIYRSLAIARFCRILGTLLRNGVPILNSLKIAKDATGNIVLRDAIGRAAENLSQGESLTVPLKASGEFPAEVVEMISVGEEANTLDTVLVDIADGMEKRTWRQLDLFVKLLEPIMLMFMAGMVLFVVLGLLLPIFRSSGIT